MKSGKSGIWTLIGCAVVGLASAPAVGAQEGTAADHPWQFAFTPYLLGAGLRGTTGSSGVTADIDASFGDILQHLDSGFMAAFEARKGPWMLNFDGVYFRLNDQQTRSWQGPGGISSATGNLEASVTQQIYQLAFGYRLLDAATRVDLIGAGRYTRLDTDLNLVTTTGGLLPGGTNSLGASAHWWDPVIGVRVIAPLAPHWSLVGYADVGGFGVGSARTYQLLAAVNWQFSESLTAKLGYRYLYQDYKQDNFIWDMAAQGAYLGLGIAF